MTPKHRWGEIGSTMGYMVGADGAPVIATAPKAFAVTNGYKAKLQVKDNSGILFNLYGFNSGPAQFIQIYNKANTPNDGSVPDGPLLWAEAGRNFEINLGQDGMFFSKGIFICNSATGPAKTLGAADLWVVAKYL